MQTIERDLRRFPLSRQEEIDMNAQLQEENKLTDLKDRAEHALQMASEKSTVYGTIASLSIQASEYLPRCTPISINGYVANSSGNGKAVGITSSETQQGFNAEAISMGTITNSQWSWSPGAPIYLNGTSLSQSSPSAGFVQQIGVAKTSDTIFVYPQQSILL